VVAGIPGAEGLLSFGMDESVKFDVHFSIAIPMFSSNILIALAIFSLVHPAYQEFAWSIYEKIGTDSHQRMVFKVNQVTKGSFLIVGWFTTLMLAYLIYFEISLLEYIIFGVLTALTLGIYVLGYHSVGTVLSNYRSKQGID